MKYSWLILKLVMIENYLFRDLVESYDLSITSSSRPGGICAVSTLINIYENMVFTLLIVFYAFALPHGKRAYVL